MATPYKRVKFLNPVNGKKAGEVADVDAATAEALVGSGDAKLLGAGSPPSTPKDQKANAGK